MGLSHFLLLPLLHDDKTLGTGLWKEILRQAEGGPARERGLQAHLLSPDLYFLSFLSLVAFPSFLSLPISFLSLLCAPLMHPGSPPACHRGKGAVIPFLHIHLLLRWAVGRNPWAPRLLPASFGLRVTSGTCVLGGLAGRPGRR